MSRVLENLKKSPTRPLPFRCFAGQEYRNTSGFWTPPFPTWKKKMTFLIVEVYWIGEMTDMTLR